MGCSSSPLKYYLSLSREVNFNVNEVILMSKALGCIREITLVLSMDKREKNAEKSSSFFHYHRDDHPHSQPPSPFIFALKTNSSMPHLTIALTCRCLPLWTQD